jgi:FAD/FMN-containing dehydrogenase
MAKKRKPKKTTTSDSRQRLPGFQGSVVPSPFDALAVATGVAGARQILFPKTRADVAVAVAGSQGQRTFVRSGMQPAEEGEASAAGSNVIHLAALNNVSLKNGILNADAGANTEAVAGQLVEKGLALPLPDNPLKSIASGALEDEPTCLIRTLGPLSGYVTKLGGVTSTGQPMTRSGTSAVERVRAENAVISGLAFKPVRANNLWMFRWVLPYPGKDRFAALVKALFANTTIPKRADLVIDATSGRQDLPIVRITAAGSSAKTRPAVTALIDEAVAVLSAETVQGIVKKSYSGPEVIKAVVDAGTSVPLDPEISTQSIRRVLEPHEDLNGFLDSVTEDVDRGLAFRDDGTGKRDEDFRLFARLQLDREDRLTLGGFMYTSKPAATEPVALLASVNATGPAGSPLHIGPILGGLFAPRIPDFNGSIYIPTDVAYRSRADQYATSSHPRDDMTPFMVAYPRDVADIQAALVFARAKQKHVVARSGGHQYSGMSSGGDATIVLSMDAFGQINRVSDNVFDVGPAVPLTTLASFFHDMRVTIPHGECPLVCIGGHAQTGGFGHLLRGYGLALDYVIAFTIVLADGTVRTVQRPAGVPATDDGELFWGVLGGNAGSFGIVTNYRIECVRDNEHPNSYGYARMQKYEKGRYKNLLKIVQEWTRGVEGGTLLDDLDFMMTVESESDTLVPPVPTLLVEMVHSNFDGPAQSVNGEQMFQPIIRAAEENAGIWVIQRARGPKPLSYLSNLFVRRPPFTFNGREFRFPYRKRINCTSGALTDEFLEGFVDLVDKVVMNTDGVYLVFQMLIGGGKFQKSNRRIATSFPRRDFVFCFVFDLFYSDGNEGKADQLQGEMQALIDAHYSGGQEQKLFWGSFGDPDMTKDMVRNCYYDDATVYARLQQLKKKVDPDDLFHTTMTVKLP